MSAAYLSPIFNGWQFLTDQGVVLGGGKIYSWVAGSTTPSPTYTDSTGAVPNTNPILLNSAGRMPQEVWLPIGVATKFTVTDANNVALVPGTYDNIRGLGDPYFNTVIGEWIQGTPPTYVNSFTFSVAGNQTSTYPAGRRVQMIITGSTLYGSVQSSIFTTSTAVVVTLDSGALNGSLSSVLYGFLNSTNVSYPGLFPNGLNVSGVSSFGSIGATDISANSVTGQVIYAQDHFIGPTQGITDGSNAATGIVGEYQTHQNLSVPVTNGAGTNITSITLSAGDWDIGGSARFTPAASTSVTEETMSWSTSSGGIGSLGAAIVEQTTAYVPGSNYKVKTMPVIRLSINSTTTFYMNAYCTFTISTMDCSGYIWARRVR